jgi:L-ascorbate metabolism protein UlaG (beta-lactamase superfamily)
MELTWYGLGCFLLTERDFPSVITDPFDEQDAGLRLPKSPVDIVLSSRLDENPRDINWPGLKGVSYTLAGPGEYEIGGVFITGVVSARNRKKSEAYEANVIYTVNYDGVVVCYLGALGRLPTQAQIEAIGRVDVLIVPVGLSGALTPSMASESASLIEPDILVPMQYKTPGLKVDRKPVTGFLKEMGVQDPTTLPSLKVTSSTDHEETQIVVLEPQAQPA